MKTNKKNPANPPVESITPGMSWGYDIDPNDRHVIDHVDMLPMGKTVPYRCPRCGYIMHAAPNSHIPCPACYGQGYFSGKPNKPGKLPDTKPGQIIPFHRPTGPLDEVPEE